MNLDLMVPNIPDYLQQKDELIKPNQNLKHSKRCISTGIHMHTNWSDSGC